MSTKSPPPPSGIKLANGSYITHGTGVVQKTVFSDLGFPVTLNELWPGTERSSPNALSYAGQMGLIDFDTSIRLPRHVHIYNNKFIHERILVLQGVALVEMNGEIYVIPPRTLVTIAPGVPHTWTACPAGVRVEGAVEGSGEVVSKGNFVMIYEYEDPTSFRPTRQIETLREVGDYVECETEGLKGIRIPLLDADSVRERCWFVCNREIKRYDGSRAS